MTGTLGREVISTRQRKIAELARREPKLTLWGHLRSFLDRRVRDGVTVEQQGHRSRSRVPELGTPGTVGAAGGQLPAATRRQDGSWIPKLVHDGRIDLSEVGMAAAPVRLTQQSSSCQVVGFDDSPCPCEVDPSSIPVQTVERLRNSSATQFAMVCRDKPQNTLRTGRPY